VRFARLAVPTFADDATVACDDATHTRIRLRGVAPERRQFQRAAHQLLVEIGEHGGNGSMV
jgi:hypothetical protein